MKSEKPRNGASRQKEVNMNNFDVKVLSQGSCLDFFNGKLYEVYTATVKLNRKAQHIYYAFTRPDDAWSIPKGYEDWDWNRFKAEVANAIGYDWDPADGSFAISQIVSEFFGVCAIKMVEPSCWTES